jgi:hypothetical protein
MTSEKTLKFPLLPNLENYQEFFQSNHNNTILLVKFYEKCHTCRNCQELTKKLENKEKVFLLEVEDKLSEIEKTEMKLRKIAKTWTYYHFIIADWFELKSSVRAKYDQEKDRPRITDLRLFIDGNDSKRV